MLKSSTLDFVGNVEGRDLLDNTADVVVTDGFTGNVALKLLEGCSSTLFARIKEAAASGATRQGGRACCSGPRCAGCERGSIRRNTGARICWACRGLVLICHGNSSRRAIANALLFGAEALRKGVLAAVDEELGRMRGGADPADS